MYISRQSKIIFKISNVVSMVFSPLFVPLYGMVESLEATPLHTLPTSSRMTSIIVVALLTAVLPLLILYLMKRAGKISDIDISNRKQRTLPLLLMLVCYILTVLYIWGVHAPAWLIMYFVSGVVTAVVLSIITVAMKWKISMHGAGVGNLIGLSIALHGYFLADINMLGWITAAILLAGVVGSARVILNRHTLAQVVAGTVISAVITFFMMGIKY